MRGIARSVFIFDAERFAAPAKKLRVTISP
jgi:hypothetical protein